MFLDGDGDAFAVILVWLMRDLIPANLSASMAQKLEAEAGIGCLTSCLTHLAAEVLLLLKKGSLPEGQ